MHEADLDKLAGMRLQLEVQVNAVESANMNANTLDVMRRGANALRDIHGGLCVCPFTHIPLLSYSNLITNVGFSPSHSHHPCPSSLLRARTIMGYAVT
jgi:hypothetical protein